MRYFILSLFLLLCSITTARATPTTLKQIELLIFYRENAPQTQERWAKANPIRIHRNWIRLQPYDNLTTQTHPLDHYQAKSTHQLTDLATAIETQGIGNIVYHQSWIQTVKPWQTETLYLAPPPTDDTPWKTTGRITIKPLSHYFDVTLQLHFCANSTLPAFIPTSPEQFIAQITPHPLCLALYQHRRTQMNQIHYFDHPLFGAILLISVPHYELLTPEKLLRPSV